jgi:hypothetical protein
VLNAARREAEQRIAAADAAHSEATEQLARSYDERINALRHELAADAARRGDADSRAVALKAQQSKALEAAQSAAREAAARLDVSKAQVAQLQQMVASAREDATAAKAAAERAQQVNCNGIHIVWGVKLAVLTVLTRGLQSNNSVTHSNVPPLCSRIFGRRHKRKQQLHSNRCLPPASSWQRRGLRRGAGTTRRPRPKRPPPPLARRRQPRSAR